MPSTYTINLGIEKPATGEQSGTWGDTTNLNFDILDQAINGAVSITLASAGTSGSPNTLAISDGAVSDGRNKWIEFVDGGDLGATAYVQLTPNDAEKIVFIRNSLSGSRSVILFQGTYDAGRDLEVPAGVDMVVKFSGGGATATTTDVFTRLRATAIETPSLTATTADINGGTVDGATIGGATPAAGTFTNLTANTNLTINATTTVDGVIDDDTMATASATKLATSESIKAYVDTTAAAQNELSEVLANGNTTGANNIIVDSGQAITTNTVNETTAGSGVTIDSVLLKDDGVNATNLEITNIKANDGTAAGSIANSTGAVTITSFISNSVDIGGGAIDDVVIGGSTPAAISGTTITGTSFVSSGNLTVDTNTLFVDAANNRVGVGTSSPASGPRLHVTEAPSGATSVGGLNTTLVESSTDAGISILTPNTNIGSIAFGDPESGAIGRIRYNHSNDGMLFQTNGSERLRIDSSGRVGIATSNPSAPLQLNDSATTGVGTTAGDFVEQFRFYGNNGNGTHISQYTVREADGSDWTTSGNRLQTRVDTTYMGWMQFNQNGGLAGISFGTGTDNSSPLNVPERMRIDASGNLLVGQTATSTPGISNTTTGVSISPSGVIYLSADAAGGLNSNRNADGSVAAFRRSGTVVGSISVTITATAYNTSSDYRLKEDVQPMSGASDRVLALNPVNFAWKADGTRVDGFLAHEAQAVVPEAVTGEKDGEEMQAIDQSKLVPLLTAALQEALQKIDALEARITALEA